MCAVEAFILYSSNFYFEKQTMTGNQNNKVKTQFVLLKADHISRGLRELLR